MTESAVVKPTPSELMEDAGTGLDYGTSPTEMLGDITPNDRFFIRSHAPSPRIDVDTWALRIEGYAVRRTREYSLAQLRNDFPLVSMVRTLECAGNRRTLFGEEVGHTFEGTQWGRGAISTAEWTGVRLRELLTAADITDDALEVMPESLDQIRARRPLPLAKALADDTIVALAMNGESLPVDHGFPARLVVSGWLGAASIKWLGRIEVNTQHLYTPWNTEDYVVIGPGQPAEGPARGPAITEPALSSLVELPWPAALSAGPQLIRGRAFAGEGSITRVEYQIDDGPWLPATITSPGSAGVWARWGFRWDATPGDHVLRVRATDDRGRTQPERTAWNELGYLHESILAHPVTVSSP
ncbi:MAG: sulfite oxidase [Mycobacterium kyogaense]|uniref:sulfite oxidase n=1 Tax=Mycobacterium kyogaense TaxID=2212479 RepID=UPI002FF764D4